LRFSLTIPHIATSASHPNLLSRYSSLSLFCRSNSCTCPLYSPSSPSPPLVLPSHVTSSLSVSPPSVFPQPSYY
jgi:hypothetical protein